MTGAANMPHPKPLASVPPTDGAEPLVDRPTHELTGSGRGDGTYDLKPGGGDDRVFGKAIFFKRQI